MTLTIGTNRTYLLGKILGVRQSTFQIPNFKFQDVLSIQ